MIELGATMLPTLAAIGSKRCIPDQPCWLSHDGGALRLPCRSLSQDARHHETNTAQRTPLCDGHLSRPPLADSSERGIGFGNRIRVAKDRDDRCEGTQIGV